MTELKNPAVGGGLPFDTAVYASPGSNYAGVPSLNQYTIYDTPAAGFATPRINIAPFVNLGSPRLVHARPVRRDGRRAGTTGTRKSKPPRRKRRRRAPDRREER